MTFSVWSDAESTVEALSRSRRPSRPELEYTSAGALPAMLGRTNYIALCMTLSARKSAAPGISRGETDTRIYTRAFRFVYID